MIRINNELFNESEIKNVMIDDKKNCLTYYLKDGKFPKIETFDSSKALNKKIRSLDGTKKRRILNG